MSPPVNWKGCNLFTTLSSHPLACSKCISRSVDSCGLRCPWRGPEWAPSTEPSARCWITVWNATGCQILDSLFLMKIPPVIPRISCSAKKNERCVYFAVGWIFSCSSQFPLWTERRRRGKQLTAFSCCCCYFSTWLLWNMWRSIARD